MVFSTIIFLLRFLPITLALYYLAPPKLKNTVLFLCSLVFYCWGEVRFFPVMLALILINYLCGLGLERFEQNKTARLILLLIALAGSLGMLFYFKYANFVLSSINAIFGTGFAPIQGISVLPLGISFYTFQTLSYTIDDANGLDQERHQHGCRKPHGPKNRGNSQCNGRPRRHRLRQARCVLQHSSGRAVYGGCLSRCGRTRCGD